MAKSVLAEPLIPENTTKYLHPSLKPEYGLIYC